MLLLFFFIRNRRPPISTLFPHTTLFRSRARLRRRRTLRSASWSQQCGGCLPATGSDVGEPSQSRETSDRGRSEEHTSELQSPDHLVSRLLIETKTLQHIHVLAYTP